MKFGKPEDNKLLDQVDFTLPEDNEYTARVLKKGTAPLKVHVGCAKWGRKEWVGLIYPKGTSEKNFLKEYVHNFTGIELNTTFYSIKKENVIKWKENAPEGFKFCPKFSRSISHIRRLNDEAQPLTDYFLEAALEFGDNLGPAFLQMPDNFSSKYLSRLEAYLKSLPEDFEMFLELRGESWYDDAVVFNEVFDMCEDLKKGVIITDVAMRRDVLHQRLTVPKAFVRFNGYNFHPSDYKRLDEWVKKVKQWQEHGLEELHFYVHQEDETNTPKTCDYFIKGLNKACNLQLQLPRFQQQFELSF